MVVLVSAAMTDERAAAQRTLTARLTVSRTGPAIARSSTSTYTTQHCLPEMMTSFVRSRPGPANVIGHQTAPMTVAMLPASDVTSTEPKCKGGTDRFRWDWEPCSAAARERARTSGRPRRGPAAATRGIKMLTEGALPAERHQTD